MLSKKFELIPIKIQFFTIVQGQNSIFKLNFENLKKFNFFTIVQGLEPNFVKMPKRFLRFYNFSNTYTCTYVV